MKQGQKVMCSLCGRTLTAAEVAPGFGSQQPIVELIRSEHPEWNENSPTCFSCLHSYRGKFIHSALQQERGELSELEREVIESLHKQETLSENLNTSIEETATFGQYLADRIAEFGGSWAFLISFAIVLLSWIAINTLPQTGVSFDPYPYILLNLILSCLASIQAPVIMMSQNRQEARDRLRAENDYRVNLKAELEIQHVNLKLDQLMSHQWQRLLEIQQIQTALLEELAKKRG